MNRSRKMVLLSGVLVAIVGAALLSLFLANQGLERAGLWATVLGAGLTTVGTVVAAWTLVITIQAARSASQVSLEPDQRVTIAPPKSHATGGMEAVTKSGYGKPRIVEADAIDPAIEFDITSHCNVDLRIDSIYLRVLECLPVHVLEIIPYAGIAETRLYTCEVGPAAGVYECSKESQSYDFIKLSPGELERIRIDPTATGTGIYKIAVGVRYSIDGELKYAESDAKVQMGLIAVDHSGVFYRDGSEQLPRDAEDALLEALGDSDQENRRAAAMQLGRFKIPAAIDELADIINDSRDSFDRVKAISLLGGYRDPRVVDILAQALSVHDRRIKYAAVDALGNTGNSTVIPILESALIDSGVSMMSVMLALRNVGADSVRVIERALTHPKPSVREEAIRALPWGDSKALVRIAGMLKDEDASVRSTAEKALSAGRAGSARWKSGEVLEQLEEARDEDSER
jgi:hypothetical protein